MQLDLTGKKHGRLTALACIGKRGPFRLWKCKCECGALTEVSTGNWGRTESCGCGRIPPVPRKHGKSRSPEYMVWKDMIARCHKPKLKNFKYYGGRGIKVCPRWTDFETFLSDMGFRPSPGHSIDRKDVNGDYEPSNCRWATRREQSINKRNTISVELDGRKLCLADWCRETNVSYSIARKHYVKTGSLIGIENALR